MHFYDQITQYRDNGLVFTKISQYEEGDPGAFCSAIYTVIIKGASFYLPISMAHIQLKMLHSRFRY